MDASGEPEPVTAGTSPGNPGDLYGLVANVAGADVTIVQASEVARGMHGRLPGRCRLGAGLGHRLILLGMRLTFPDPPLSAAGIILRRLEPGDIAWITAACSDRELSRYIPEMPYPYSHSDARSHAEHAARGWAEGSSATFVIARTPGGEGLGMIELQLVEADPGVAEVGYWLRREARGHGAATAAVRLAASWAFNMLGIERLNLTTAPDNEASQRVAERAGFTREGLLRAWAPTATGRRDSVMFSLLPDDRG